MGYTPHSFSHIFQERYPLYAQGSILPQSTVCFMGYGWEVFPFGPATCPSLRLRGFLIVPAYGGKPVGFIRYLNHKLGNSGILPLHIRSNKVICNWIRAYTKLDGAHAAAVTFSFSIYMYIGTSPPQFYEKKKESLYCRTPPPCPPPINGGGY